MPEADKILSQHEVDALLSAIDSGAAPGTEHAAEPYDFRRPSKIPPEPLRFLHSLHRNFARTLQSALSGLLLRPVEARLASVHPVPLGEFTDALPQPMVGVLASAAPLEGNFLLAIDPSIAYPLLERLLGAGKVGAPQRDRPLSPLEWNVAGTLIGRIFELLAASWATLAPVAFKILRRETEPRALKFDNVNEPTVGVSVEIALGEQRGTLQIAFPVTAVEPHFSRMVSTTSFSAKKPDAGGESAAAMSRRLAPAEVELGVHLILEAITLKDLEALRPGDILVTHHPHGAPMRVTVEGRPKFLGRLGCLKEKKAVKILAPAGPPALLPSRTRLEVIKGEAAASAEASIPPALQLPVTAAVVVGEKTMRMKDVLAIRPGEIVELARGVEEPLELRVGDRAVAEGTCVKVGDHLGLRITAMRPPPG